MMSGEEEGHVANGTTRQARSNGTLKSRAATNGSKAARTSPAATYHGHDREEVTRLLIQALSDMGYQAAAENVSEESGYALESSTVAAWRKAILEGDWPETEKLLSGASRLEQGDAVGPGPGNGLVLAHGVDENAMRFWLRQQKYMELLEKKDNTSALRVLRQELTTLHYDADRVHFLSSLLMYPSVEEIKAKADWDGAQGASRRVLLSELSKCVSPSIMLPENRLAVLMQQVKQKQIEHCIWHTSAASPSLYSDHLCDQVYFPSEAVLELSNLRDSVAGQAFGVHEEAWGLQFSNNGKYLAAWGSSKRVMIWDTVSWQEERTLDGHEFGCVKLAWSPDDSKVVTCGQDKHTRLWDPKSGRLLHEFERLAEPVTGCVWSADGQTFVTSSLDKGRGLQTWNLRGELVHDWKVRHRVQDMCGSPDGLYVVAVDDASNVLVYDAHARELLFDFELKSRATSVSFSADSRSLLINQQNGEAHLHDVTGRAPVHIQKYLGHTGGVCLIRSSMGGADESFVLSGSEDGKIFIWHKHTGAVVRQLQGHQPRSNAVVWSPSDPCLVASCGDDGLVKIWSNKFRSEEFAMARAAPQCWDPTTVRYTY